MNTSCSVLDVHLHEFCLVGVLYNTLRRFWVSVRLSDIHLPIRQRPIIHVHSITLIPSKVFSRNLKQIWITIRQRAKDKNRNSTYSFCIIMPHLKVLVWKSWPLCKFKTVEDIFINELLSEMCRKKWTVTPSILFAELLPFEIFGMKVVSAL